MEKERNPGYNLRILRIILIEGFSIDEMQVLAADICGNHEVILSKGCTLEKSAVDLIDWCRRHNKLGSLAKMLREQRRELFEEHQAELEKADMSGEGVIAEIQASSSNIQAAVNQLRAAEKGAKSADSRGTSADGEDHPLSKDINTVRRWFRDDLSLEQQAFVISAALFHGLQQYDLLEIAAIVNDMLQPPAADEGQVNKVEAKSAEKEAAGPKEQVINLNISLNTGKAEAVTANAPVEKRASAFEDEGDLLEIANLVIDSATRNTESGVTKVRIVQFRSEAQREKIIQLLANNFTGIVWKLVPLIRTLGAHPRAEIRARSALAVGELLRVVDFIRIKDDVLIPWALSPSMDVSLGVGIALQEAIRDEQYIDNTKNLLRHWVTSSNPDFNWTALACYIPLCLSWPEEAMKSIESAMRKETFIAFLALCSYIVRELCKNGYQEDVIRKLTEWLHEEKGESNVRLGAALIFIDAIDFGYIKKGSGLLDKAIGIFKIGLSDRRLDSMGMVRSAMLDKLRCWAEESFEQDGSEEIETLFVRLFLRSDDRGKERIKFSLEKWRRKAAQKSDNRLSSGYDGLISVLPE